MIVPEPTKIEFVDLDIRAIVRRALETGNEHDAAEMIEALANAVASDGTEPAFGEADYERLADALHPETVQMAELFLSTIRMTQEKSHAQTS